MGGKDKSALITSAENADDLTGAHEKAPFVVANSMREVPVSYTHLDVYKRQAELARRADPTTWGSTPFRIGLWVGSDVSPKKVKDAAAQLRDVSEGKGFRLTALQFKRCPWCGQAIGPANVRHVPETDRILVSCANALGSCPFAFGNGPEGCDEGLPVLTVDEEILSLIHI